MAGPLNKAALARLYCFRLMHAGLLEAASRHRRYPMEGLSTP